MKRLAIFLCGVLLLASCEDIDEARMLPTEFSIVDITDLSELTYDEVENLAINSDYQDPSYLREEMRRTGGLIVKGAVNPKEGEAYDYARLWLSDKESELPADGGYWGSGNAYQVETLTGTAGSPLFYVRSWDMVNFQENQASIFYYKMALESWNNEYPGFLDDCLYEDYYSRTVFSSVKSYSKETPYILDCAVEEGGALGMSFTVRSNYTVTQCGMCYSNSNQLPDLKDKVAYYNLDSEADNREVYVHPMALPEESGTYYVRGFAVSEKGISYSPVQKATIY